MYGCIDIDINIWVYIDNLMSLKYLLTGKSA